MRYKTRSLPWRGELFHFERLPADAVGDFVWAVSRRGEFIGTMPAIPNETTKEFDLRSFHWVSELLRVRPLSP
jgi:hypothetical protein